MASSKPEGHNAARRYAALEAGVLMIRLQRVIARPDHKAMETLESIAFAKQTSARILVFGKPRFDPVRSSRSEIKTEGRYGNGPYRGLLSRRIRSTLAAVGGGADWTAMT